MFENEGSSVLYQMLKVAGPRPGYMDRNITEDDFKFEYKPIGGSMLSSNTRFDDIASKMNTKPVTPGRAVSPGSGQNFGMSNSKRKP